MSRRARVALVNRERRHGRGRLGRARAAVPHAVVPRPHTTPLRSLTRPSRPSPAPALEPFLDLQLSRRCCGRASVPACSRAVARGVAPPARALATSACRSIRFLGKRSKSSPSAAPARAREQARERRQRRGARGAPRRALLGRPRARRRAVRPAAPQRRRARGCQFGWRLARLLPREGDARVRSLTRSHNPGRGKGRRRCPIARVTSLRVSGAPILRIVLVRGPLPDRRVGVIPVELPE